MICHLKREFRNGFGDEVSLRRDIILDIKLRDQQSPLVSMSLFHAIDYVEDKSKLWIDGSEGAGSAAHIFTFHEGVQQADAEEFITGLQWYIAHDKDMTLQIFDSDHFELKMQHKNPKILNPPPQNLGFMQT